MSRAWGRLRPAVLVVVVFGTVIASLVVLHFADGPSWAFATTGTISMLMSIVPGRIGRVAATATLILAMACVASDPSAASVTIGLLLVLGAFAGQSISAELPSLSLIFAAASVDRLTRESVLLDERARAELARARRCARPLSVISFTVESERGRTSAQAVVAAAQALAGVLRITDLVGATEEGVAIVILPDTPSDAINDLSLRLGECIAAIGSRARVGHATFPDDAVTWRELRAIASERTGPLSANLLRAPPIGNLTVPEETPA